MDKIELLITAEEISQKIAAVAAKLNAKYAEEELTLVMVMKGAFCLTADLMRCLKMPCILEFIQASSYGERGTSRGELSLSGIDSIDLSNKNVLVVDDIFDSGNTLAQILEQLRKKHPKTLESLVLLNKKISRPRPFAPDYSLFDI
ncbi:MAG: phosphoribosyltransferase family protein, partial [Chlamydiota bacterium]